MPPKSRLARKLTSAIPWAIGEGFLSALATFLTTLVAARFVAPEQFGLASIAIAVPAIIQAVLLTGPTVALTRAPHVDGQISDSVFWSMMVLGIIGFVLCVLLAPVLEHLYAEPQLSGLMILQGTTCILQAAAVVPTALLSRKMRTRALTTRTLWQKIAGFVITGAAAIAGFGAWAIVLGSTFGMAVATVVLLFRLPQRPRLRFSWPAALPTLRLGALISVEGTAGAATPRAILLIFGWFQDVEALGLLNFGVRLIDELANVVNMATARIALPMFASLRTHGLDVRAAFIKASLFVTALTGPMLLGLAAISADLVPLVFGERWTAAVLAVQVVAFFWALRFTRIFAPAVLLSEGKQTPQIINSWTALVVGVVATLVLARFEFGVAVWSYAAPVLATVPLGMVLLARHSRAISVPDQFYVMRPLIGALLMFAAVEILRHTFFLGMDPAVRIVASVAAGMLVYTAWVAAFERGSVALVGQFFKQRRQNRLPNRSRGS
ncbi:oligosaccharide flippase family protein [Terrihabitans rhizophilus]|uniref:Oligosaccharide flippase family protein n=1 Tax=Terrihabitans rhizophilus TaxID=3092662 RepID=A0ABU4RLP8_9HYPH|nr:oligosaccharide flippase family protein [Terrihabitans sp. PJ23]MDX6805748.1 oligosaccharide flippase family protein [Terrihabitans sp. PJ23]